jgi:hypothetical protein
MGLIRSVTARSLLANNANLSNALSQNSIKPEPVEVRILIKACY